jgi:hypothetical protein
MTTMMRRTRSRHWLVLLSLALLLGGLALPAPGVSAAATYTVDVLTDTGAGTGTTGDLRYAITQVNAGAGGDTINITATGTITLGSALPTLGKSVTIPGPGANLLTISGNHAVQVFHVTGSVTANISNLTIANGTTPFGGFGGGILVDKNGTVSVTNGIFSGTSATSGGAIANLGGTVTVTNTTFSGNGAQIGGAIFNAADSPIGAFNSNVTVTNCTFVGNSTAGPGFGSVIGGGAIYNLSDLAVGGGLGQGILSVTNSTFTGNNATDGNSEGGAIENQSTMTVTNSTITANNGAGGAGGVDTPFPGTVTNTIISGNTGFTGGGAYSPDILGSYTGSTNLIGGTALLGPLGDYGGSIQTIPLLPGSPAIGAGTTGVGIPTTDQRGVARTGHTDIGAFQSQGFTLTKTGGDNQSQQVGAAFTTPLTLTVSATAAGAPYNEPVQGGKVIVTPPPNGASATVSGNAGAVAANGLVSIVATANGTVGGPYQVIISSAGSTFTTAFSLTNVAAPAGTTYTVGSTIDHAGGLTSAATCRTAANTTCTLRDAVVYATSGTDTILFNGTGQGTITLGASGTLTLAANVTIDATGHSVVVDGGCTGCDLGRSYNPSDGVTVFVVNSGVTATITDLTIRHGFSNSTDGAGIYNGGTLTVTNSTFSANAVKGALGGGISNDGTLTVTNSTFTGNAGGGIYNQGTATVTNSTLSGNADGGIGNYGTLMVTNSTFSGNSASYGGGIVNGGTLTVTNSTITGNSTDVIGGGMFYGGTVTVTNTIVAGNTAPSGGPDLFGLGPITSGGNNLIGTTSGSTGITNGVNGDIVNPTPLLGPFGNNGGSTQTIPLLPGSPAIDAGNDAICAQTGPGKVGGVDQRGITRPHGAHCDIGAFEYQVVNPLPPPQPTVPAAGAPSPLPGSRPAGTTGGPAPNPLPAPRP